jgi:tRNA threonylcarbamoyladenosine biosynthesis protein TsaE
MTEYQHYLSDEAETEAFGRALASATQVAPPRTKSLGGRVYLRGELGAGKTTLTRGVLRGYGHLGAVKSPTYTLVEPYEEPEFNIYHFDLYRLADPEEVEFLGVFDYFDEANLCLIEWAERGVGYLPAPDLEITLSMQGRGRLVRWESRSPHGEGFAARLFAYTEFLRTGNNTQ